MMMAGSKTPIKAVKAFSGVLVTLFNLKFSYCSGLHWAFWFIAWPKIFREIEGHPGGVDFCDISP